MRGNMVIVKKEVESVPMALDENLKPIKNKKYLSSINY